MKNEQERLTNELMVLFDVTFIRFSPLTESECRKLLCCIELLMNAYANFIVFT